MPSYLLKFSFNASNVVYQKHIHFQIKYLPLLPSFSVKMFFFFTFLEFITLKKIFDVRVMLKFWPDENKVFHVLNSI